MSNNPNPQHIDPNYSLSICFTRRISNVSTLSERIPNFNLEIIRNEARTLHMAYVRSALAPAYYLFDNIEAHDSKKGLLTTPQLTVFDNLSATRQKLWMASTVTANEYFVTLNPRVKDSIKELIQTLSDELNTWLNQFGVNRIGASASNILPYVTHEFTPAHEQMINFLSKTVRSSLCDCALAVDCDYSVPGGTRTHRPYNYTPRGTEMIRMTLSDLLYEIAEKVHNEECRQLLADGWTYKNVYDVTNKTTPALLPFVQCYRDNGKLQNEILYAIDVARIILCNVIKLA